MKQWLKAQQANDWVYYTVMTLGMIGLLAVLFNL